MLMLILSQNIPAQMVLLLFSVSVLCTSWPQTAVQLDIPKRDLQAFKNKTTQSQIVCIMVSKAARTSTTYMFEGVEIMIISPQVHNFPHSHRTSLANPTQSRKATILQEKHHTLSLKKCGVSKIFNLFRFFFHL